jgi:hypothetical protein
MKLEDASINELIQELESRMAQKFIQTKEESGELFEYTETCKKLNQYMNSYTGQATILVIQDYNNKFLKRNY